MPEHRKLAAILAADVVGYSRLVAADETGTLTRLRTLRAEVVDPAGGSGGPKGLATIHAAGRDVPLAEG